MVGLGGARLLELAAIVSRLQTVCPWTKQQTAADMVAFTRKELAETEEAMAAVRCGVGDALAASQLESELGDVLFDALMLIEASRTEFGTASVERVCETTIAKLRRRAPYAFDGGPTVESVDDAAKLWLAGKAAEQEAGDKAAAAPDASQRQLVQPLGALAIAADEPAELDGLEEWREEMRRDLDRGSSAASDSQGSDSERSDDGRAEGGARPAVARALARAAPSAQAPLASPLRAADAPLADGSAPSAAGGSPRLGAEARDAVAPSARDDSSALLPPMAPAELDGLDEWQREVQRDFDAGDFGRASDDEWRETDDDEDS